MAVTESKLVGSLKSTVTSINPLFNGILSIASKFTPDTSTLAYGLAIAVVDRRGRAGQVVDLVHLHIQRKRDIVAHQFKVRVGQQVGNVFLGTAVEVVEAQHVAAFVD